MALPDPTGPALGTQQADVGINFEVAEEGGQRYWKRVPAAAAHDAVTLAAGNDGALALVGQELNLTLPATVVNLGETTSATTFIVTNDAGTNSTIPAATTTVAGVLSAADKTALDGAVTAQHAAVTLAAGNDAALALAGQELNLTLPAATTLTQAQAENGSSTASGQVTGERLKQAFDTHIAAVGNSAGTHDASGGTLPTGTGVVNGDYVRITVPGVMPAGVLGAGNIADANDLMWALTDNPANPGDWALAKSTSPGTNLSQTVTATTVTINSDTGGDVSVAGATAANAGLLIAADKVALDAAVAAQHAAVTLAAGNDGALAITGQELNLTLPATVVNLGETTSATTFIVTNDAGTDATIPAATTTVAGVLSAADKTDLDANTTARHDAVTLNAGVDSGLTITGQELNLQQPLTNHTDVNLATKVLADGRTLQREAGVWVNGSWTKTQVALPANASATDGDTAIRFGTNVAGLDGIWKYDAAATSWIQMAIWN